jgi:YfiH family protein
MRVLSTILAEYEAISHGFFTREGGVSKGIFAGLNCGPGSGDDPAALQENRRRVGRALSHPGREAIRDLSTEIPDSPSGFRDVPFPLCTLHQIHSSEVITVMEPFTERPQADAMVTNQPGVIVGILTADCGPILFCDPVSRVIGAAHAGWKGAISGVLENTIQAMEALGATRERIMAAIGPCIAQSSYEIGQEFYQRFVQEQGLYGTFFKSSSFVTPSNDGVRMPSRRPAPADAGDGMIDKYYFDLSGFIEHRLAQSGLQRIESLAMDTYSDETRFFSYRRTTHRGEPDYGRQISAIMIRP